ncbi:MAG: hypothetical protein A2135_00125 [Actinobacteria bacterium RBG_16_67_15]|nr:MAG: hypothetical protein A2135_00125 [Actinobacteria bacterium RBG_16_67_15]
MTDTLRHPGKPTLGAEAEEQAGGAQPTGGDHNSIGGEGLHSLTEPGPGVLRHHHPSAVIVFHEIDHLPLGEDPGAALFGEMEVGTVDGVLRLVTTADHAPAAFDASDAPGSDPAVERIGHWHSRLSAVHRDVHRVMGVLPAEVAGDGGDDLIGRRIGAGLGHTEHPAGLVVPGGQFGLPVGDPRPLQVVEELFVGFDQSVGVHERPAADSRPGEGYHLAEEVDSLDPPHPQAGKPQEATQVPGGLGEVPGAEATTGLEYQHPVPLLGESQGADSPTETASDDDDVGVVGHQGTVDRT